MLPGDERLIDAAGGDRPSDVIARYLAELGSQATASREMGLAAVQVWQALSERVGRGSGVVDVTIMFTDLVGFSAWTLSAGDELGLELLRRVAGVVEPEIGRRDGRIVKRLGDGHMAVFGAPDDAIEAALAIQEQIADVELEGFRPQLRVGLHRGRPRRLGGDYLGTDVNIAARVADAAKAGEVLASAQTLEGLDHERLDLRRRRFRAKGAPRDLEVHAVRRA